MNTISTTDFSTEGYTHESISLVELFDSYVIIRFFKVSGCADEVEAFVLQNTADAELAKKLYKYYGGVLDKAMC